MYACIRFNAWRPCICAAATALAILLLDGSALADTLHVPADFRTIQSAIDAAADGDEVLVAPGTYHEAIDFLGKAITVRSSGGAEVTTIDASLLAGYVSVVTVASGEPEGTTLEGFTISGGTGTPTVPYFFERGGGVYVNRSMLIIRNCVIAGNSAVLGAGLAVVNEAALTMESCFVHGNHTVPDTDFISGGGGLHFASASVVHASNVVFSDNIADVGAAVSCLNNEDARTRAVSI